jgi:hypothetical protein
VSRNKLGFVAILLVIFGFGILNTTVGAQEKATLEQRVASLEQQLSNQQLQIQSLSVFRMQYESWTAGRYSAILYSTVEKRVRFDADTDFLNGYSQLDYTCGSCDIGDHTYITLYDQYGTVLDRVEFADKLKAGDLVTAWYTDVYNGGPSTTSEFYGKPWVKPFYWNAKTGLAVAIYRINDTIVQ